MADRKRERLAPLIASITERNSIGWLAGVTFTYDARGRLTREVRTDINGSPAYDFTYEYDQGGNLTMKIDSLVRTCAS